MCSYNNEDIILRMAQSKIKLLAILIYYVFFFLKPSSPKCSADYVSTLQDEWRQVFIIAAEVYIAGTFLYMILASGEIQEWATLEDDKSKDKSTQKELMNSEKIENKSMQQELINSKKTEKNSVHELINSKKIEKKPLLSDLRKP